MSVSLQHLLAKGRLRRQKTSPTEIARLFEVAERDLADAQLPGLSADRRFATAYNAALQLATIVLRAEGYRTGGTGHHATAIAAFRAIVGPKMEGLGDYLDACRSKRNTVDYDGVGVASQCEVEEVVVEARRMQSFVRTWLARHHPELLS